MRAFHNYVSPDAGLNMSVFYVQAAGYVYPMPPYDDFFYNIRVVQWT